MEDPVPGNAPNPAPIPAPRNIAGAEARQSARVGIISRQRGVRAAGAPPRAALAMTSATPNRPIAIATRPIPSTSSGRPKTKRKLPVCRSVPTVPSSSPATTMISPRRADPCVSSAAAISPSTISAKYSAAWNAIAARASTGAKPASSSTPSTEPANDAMVVMNSATPALPCCAIG